MNRSEFKAVRWLHCRGRFYMRAGKYEQSMACLLIAIQLAPDNKALLLTLVATFLKIKDGVRAIKALDRLAQLGEQKPYFTLMRSQALWLIGEEFKARELFNQYIADKA